MLWFHVRQFARNGYFVQLLITSTLTIVILQALAARAPSLGAASSGPALGLAWLRAGMLGTWTVCAVSSGMLGYQRFQGTLVYLVRSPHHPMRVLLPVLGAASVFGLLALPLAAIGSALLGEPVNHGGVVQMIMSGLTFWVACLAISSLIGMVFVLTPNAMTYEGLLSIPLVLVSGVFGTPAFLPNSILMAARILPTRSAVELLHQVSSGGRLDYLLLAESVAASLIWLGATAGCARIVIKRATQTATLEVV